MKKIRYFAQDPHSVEVEKFSQDTSSCTFVTWLGRFFEVADRRKDAACDKSSLTRSRRKRSQRTSWLLTDVLPLSSSNPS
ncbi:MAG TPA: hypothetical protein VEG65_03650 [Candidatus Bathyarchaeia archaeon]|nr:hypothetical protein [Candidatus Bathyarchaeia archaeon]